MEEQGDISAENMSFKGKKKKTTEKIFDFWLIKIRMFSFILSDGG